jgi:hypothetical protein
MQLSHTSCASAPFLCLRSLRASPFLVSATREDRRMLLRYELAATDSKPWWGAETSLVHRCQAEGGHMRSCFASYAPHLASDQRRGLEAIGAVRHGNLPQSESTHAHRPKRWLGTRRIAHVSWCMSHVGCMTSCSIRSSRASSIVPPLSGARFRGWQQSIRAAARRRTHAPLNRRLPFFSMSTMILPVAMPAIFAV